MFFLGNGSYQRIFMSDVIVDEVIEESKIEEGDFVPKKAYASVSQDMHKFKTQLKETQAELNRLKVEKEAAEKQNLVDSEQWKILYEKTQHQLDEVARTRSQEKDQFVNYHKKNAVIRELGGFKKDEYNNFINVSSVEMDENGNISAESLAAEVNRLKQTYPELIKTVTPQNLPSNAPKSIQESVKDYSALTPRERDEMKRKLLLQAHNKN